jgi:ribosome-binding factor A
MTERTARVDQLLQEEISRIVVREVHDPRIGFATVTRVETSPDLRHAKVWVSIIGQPDERRTTFRALARAMPFVRHELGVLRLRRIPELHLEIDDSVQRGARVLQILDDIEAGREPAPPEPGETLPTPGPVHLDEPVPGMPAFPLGAAKGAAKPARRRPHAPRSAGSRPARRTGRR